MNAHVNISYEEHLKAEARAREERKKAAARKLLNPSPVEEPDPVDVGAPSRFLLDAYLLNFKQEVTVPPFFSSFASFTMTYGGEYCAFSGSSEMIQRNRSMKEIILANIKLFHGVTIAEINGASRNKREVFPRHVMMYIVRKERPDLSLPMIGRFFGGRDHTSILFAVNKVQKMVDDGSFVDHMNEWQDKYGKKRW